MIKLALFVVLSTTAAHSVQAGDTKDSLQDIMDFCNQFVIRDPDSGIRLDYHHYDCFFHDGADAPSMEDGSRSASHR
jgi:hypothetical protein